MQPHHRGIGAETPCHDSVSGPAATLRVSHPLLPSQTNAEIGFFPSTRSITRMNDTLTCTLPLLRAYTQPPRVDLFFFRPSPLMFALVYHHLKLPMVRVAITCVLHTPPRH